MGYLFDEKDFIESNIYLHESRINSQYARFLDRSPTFVTYYRVNNIESTTDRGFLNVERILGNNSPIRFNEVTRLPMYGIEQIVLDLQLEDQGLDTNYEGSAILLPNTVIPRPNDFFIIDHLGSSIVFMVTNLQYDTIRSNNFYRIDFKVKYIDDGEAYESILSQTVDKFTCYYENVGTEDKVLVRTVDSEIISELNKLTTQVANYYKMLYFDSRYNSFLFNRADGYRLYDRVLTRFINRNRLFSNRKGYETVFLSDEDQAVTVELEYHNSIFRAVEKRDPSLIKDNKYLESFVFDLESVFTRWRDKRVISIVQGAGIPYYLRPDLLEFFRNAKNIFTDENKPEDIPSDENDLNELYPGESAIIIPDEESKPVYVEDKNIFVKYSDVIKDEEDALKIKREDEGDGVLDLDSLFNGEDSKSDELLPLNPEPVDLEPKPEPVIIKEIDLTPEFSGNVIPDSEPVTVDEEHTNTYVFEVEKFVPEYLQTPENYSNENIMTIVIAKYFSGKDLSLYELNIEELKDYVSYIDMNSRESFILVPIFLYVLEQYFIKHLGK